MAKASPIHGSFTTGEISPLMYGNVSADRYKQSLFTCLNYVPTIQGGLTRRPGTEYIGSVKTAAKETRLIPFKFSATDAVMLEFGDLYIRFYSSYAQVQDYTGAAAYEITTTYTEAELFDITVAQSADVLYIFHPNHLPAKLSRYSANQWALANLDVSHGPWESNSHFLQLVSSTVAISAGATFTATPAIIGTITAMGNNGGQYEITVTPLGATLAAYTKIRIYSIAGAPRATGDWTAQYIGSNKYILLGSTYAAGYNYPVDTQVIRPQVFQSSDVGRYLEVNDSVGDWKRALVTAVTHSMLATVTILDTLDNVTNLYLRFGLFSPTVGPKAGCFFEDRLFLAGVSTESQRVDGSKTGDYENFTPTAIGGTVVASDAVSFTLNSNDVNSVKWLFSDEKGLLAGTLSSEWVVKSASSQEAISATSISAKQPSSVGSADCYPVQSGKAVLFVQKSGRKLREFHYFYDVDGFRATDLSVLAEHVTTTGLKQLAYAKDPQQIIWGVKNDGSLVGLTYDRDIDNLRAGWHRHEIGGSGIIESIAVIPSPDGTKDDLWMIVKRTVNGSTVRYIEYLTKFFDDEDLLQDANFVDCGLTYDVPKTITGATAANPVVITSVAHGFSNGDSVIISELTSGMTNLEGNIYTVANVAANTFELSGINGTAFTAYTSGGVARKRVQTISGLSHLEGKEVTILGDGAVQASKTVSGGAITLATKAGLVHVGLGYSSDGELPRLDAGSTDGTSIGKTRRTNRVGFMVHRSLNLKIGENFDELTRIYFREPANVMGQATPLFSGIITETFSADYNFENNVCWRQDQPLPSTILAVMPQLTTQDR
jgi:hypothetical protein